MVNMEAITLGNDKIIYIDGKKKDDCESIFLSDDKRFFHITFFNNKTKYKYPVKRVEIKNIKPHSGPEKEVFDYFSVIASLKDLQGGNLPESGVGFYRKRVNALAFASEDSALHAYFNKENRTSSAPFPVVFPFGINLSQINAVENTFSRQISMVEGPPGTGKTQTILNIIASAVVRNLRVAVVSPNNAATKNVHEKLIKEGYGFIAASLGKQEYREKFFAELEDFTPDERLSPLTAEDYLSISNSLNNSLAVLKELFEKKNKQAVLRQKLREWRQEYKYFSDYYRPEGDCLEKLRRIKLFPFSSDKKWT
ncbi:AAA domain-containing protein [Erwinia sp. V71]|uniref:AAA domain-containing protein n=1 Tax=Erwinia sp. V71 TaxID=3369424 RepID=UPI003F60673F